MRVFERIARASARRPGRVLAAVALLAVAGSLLALRLEPSAATETLVGRGADTYEATERYRERFGDHSVVVLVRGELPDVLLTSNLGRLIGLEGCLSGNKPEGEAAPGGRGSPVRPARRAQAGAGRVRAGHVRQRVGGRDPDADPGAGARPRRPRRHARPGRRARWRKAQGKSRAEQQRVAASARQLVYAGFVRDLLQINLRYGLGLTGLPSVDDPNFISALYFDPSRGATTPKARFAYLLPSSRGGGRPGAPQAGPLGRAASGGRGARPRGGRACRSGT